MSITTITWIDLSLLCDSQSQWQICSSSQWCMHTQAHTHTLTHAHMHTTCSWELRLCITDARFRRQHEQLRQVIVRVLRPAALPARIGSATEKKSDVMKEAMALEATDANAIEVRWSYILEVRLSSVLLFLPKSVRTQYFWVPLTRVIFELSFSKHDGVYDRFHIYHYYVHF